MTSAKMWSVPHRRSAPETAVRNLQRCAGRSGHRKWNRRIISGRAESPACFRLSGHFVRTVLVNKRDIWDRSADWITSEKGKVSVLQHGFSLFFIRRINNKNFLYKIRIRIIISDAINTNSYYKPKLNEDKNRSLIRGGTGMDKNRETIDKMNQCMNRLDRLYYIAARKLGVKDNSLLLY